MLKYWLWLTERPGLTNQVRLALLRHFGTPEAVYYADPEELLLTEGITAAQVQHLSERNLEDAENILEACDRLHQHILTIQDAAYPDRLKNIYDPPCLLYWQGHLPAFDEEAAIAVVGTRIQHALWRCLCGEAGLWSGRRRCSGGQRFGQGN